MSYVFESNDITIWEPSRNVATCFLAQLQFLENLVGTTSGLNESMSDTIEIDRSSLQRFLQQVITKVNWENSSLSLLLHGAVVHLLGLAMSDGNLSVTQIDRLPSRWVEEARQFAESSTHPGMTAT